MDTQDEVSGSVSHPFKILQKFVQHCQHLLKRKKTKALSESVQ